MTEAQQPAAKTSNKKWMGCGIAALVVAVLFGGTTIFIIYKLFTPGPTQSTAGIAGAETVSMVRVVPDLDDPNLGAMYETGIKAWVDAQQKQMGQLPPNMQWVQMFNRSANPRQASREMKKLVPSEVTVIWEPDAAGKGQSYVLGLSMSKLPRAQVKMYTTFFGIVGETIEHTTPTKTHTIMSDAVGGQKATFFAVEMGNTFLVSDDREAIKRALDRMDGPESTAEVPANMQAAAFTRDVKNVKGCERANAHANATAPDKIEANIEIQCDSPRAAALAKAEAAKEIAKLDAKLTQAKMTLSHRSQVSGSRVEIELQVDDVDAGIEHMVGNFFTGQSRGAPSMSAPPPLPSPYTP